MFVRRWSLRSKALALLAIAAGVGSFAIVRGYAAELDALRPDLADRVSIVVYAGAAGVVLFSYDSLVDPRQSTPDYIAVVGRSAFATPATASDGTR